VRVPGLAFSHHLDDFADRDLRLERIQKADELLMPVVYLFKALVDYKVVYLIPRPEFWSAVHSCFVKRNLTSRRLAD
jgi:hypothetical protein